MPPVVGPSLQELLVTSAPSAKGRHPLRRILERTHVQENPSQGVETGSCLGLGVLSSARAPSPWGSRGERGGSRARGRRCGR